MIKQRVIAVGAAIGLMFSLSACGGQTVPSDAVQETQLPSPSDAAEEQEVFASTWSNQEEGIEPPYILEQTAAGQVYQTEDSLQLIHREAGFALAFPETWKDSVEITWDHTACRVEREGEAPFVVRGVKKGEKAGNGEVMLGSNKGMTYYFCVGSALDATEKMRLLQTVKEAFFLLDVGPMSSRTEETMQGAGLQAGSTDGMFYVNTARGITVHLPKECSDQFGGIRYDASSVYFYRQLEEASGGEGQQVYHTKYSPFYIYFITEEQAERGIMDELEQTAYEIEARNGIRYYIVLEEESGQAQQQIRQVEQMISWIDAA